MEMGRPYREAGLPDLKQFMRAPAVLSTDVSLVKGALGAYLTESSDVGMSQDDIEVLRWHGAKATLSSIMQHLGIQKKAVRFQGGWASRAETMPDCYLREAQTLLIEAQQKCLTYLRDGGDLIRLEGTRIGPRAEEEEEGRRSKAMAWQSLPATFAARVPAAFWDEGHDAAGKVAEERMALEKTIYDGGGDFSECLVDEEDDTSSGYSPSIAEDEDQAEEQAAQVDPEAAMDEVDSEGMTAYWVQAKTPTAKTKVHLPASQCFVDGNPVRAIPKCGMAGSFDFVKADEVLEIGAQLCRRCSPTTTERGCEAICSHMHLSRDVRVYRCHRRCDVEGAHDEHLCSLHAGKPRREGQ